MPMSTLAKNTLAVACREASGRWLACGLLVALLGGGLRRHRRNVSLPAKPATNNPPVADRLRMLRCFPKRVTLQKGEKGLDLEIDCTWKGQSGTSQRHNIGRLFQRC